MPSTPEIRAFQKAILEGLGLKGRSVTRLSLSMEPNQLPRLEIEEVLLNGTQPERVRRILSGMTWVDVTEAEPDGR